MVIETQFQLQLGCIHTLLDSNWGLVIENRFIGLDMYPYNILSVSIWQEDKQRKETERQEERRERERKEDVSKMSCTHTFTQKLRVKIGL